MYFWQCALAVVAGAMLPLQAAINSQLRHRLESHWYATIVSVLVSTLSMIVFCLIIRAPLPNVSAAFAGPWWIWVGGIIGVFFVCCALTLAPILGTTSLIASIIGGQLLCSVLIDQFGLIGIPQHTITIQRAIGIVLLLAGVFLIQKN